MLNSGLGTLSYLKSRILPAGAGEILDWDETLTKLGLAVATKFQNHCNRVFDRTEDKVDEFNASATSIVLRAYPVEAITSVELRYFDGTTDDFGGGWQLDQGAGLMLFQTHPGNPTERIVITYTGGYWLDDGRTQPAGSAALPDDLLEAWVMQCQAWAEGRNLFGTVSLSGMEAKPDKPSPINLTPEVDNILRPYRRFSGE